ncbi:hypothetical protein M0Q50_02465 [bacterium]|jgi:hypothetical protein|nr:hypothetical protein [bacterium]
MKTLEQYNDKEIKELFLHLAHLDELHIKFDFFGYSNFTFYFYEENCIFMECRIFNTLGVNYKDVYSKL